MVSWSSRKKKRTSFVPFILSKENISEICVLSRCIVYWIHFNNIHAFTYQKTLLHTLFLLVFKTIESTQCILNILKLVVIRDQNIQRSNSLKWIARYFVSLVSVDINRFLNYFPVNIDLCKVKKRNGRKKCEICSKLTIKTQERRHWHCCGVFIGS